MRQSLFWLISKYRWPYLRGCYDLLQAKEYCKYEDRLELQLERLQKITEFAKKTIPYYADIFHHGSSEEIFIRNIKDLDLVPISSKKELREVVLTVESHFNRDNGVLRKRNYPRGIQWDKTGGSTGSTLIYYMTDEDATMGFAHTLHVLTRAGYRPGDRLAVLAGGSLISNKKQNIKNKIRDFIISWRHYPFYGVTKNDLNKYFDDMKRWQPKYLRGYASALFAMAVHIRNSGLMVEFPISGVFTTAEQLLPHYRETIESVFHTKVYNDYGLNDGGVSATECKFHTGMHVDMERAILQVVDETGSSVLGKPGRIIATNLYNTATPFIRYDTGDIGELTFGKCDCGIEGPRLITLMGRSTDILKINARIIGSPVLTLVLGETGAEKYQIVQNGPNNIEIIIVPNPTYDRIKSETYIKNSLISHLGDFSISFLYVDHTHFPLGEKHKFIINNYIEEINSQD